METIPLNQQERAKQDAVLLCREAPTRVQGKNHGAWNHYEDDKIHLALDTYAFNLCVTLATGEIVLGYHLGHCTLFRPGKWMEYLAEKAESVRERKRAEKQAKEQRQEEEQNRRFAPVDDSDLFD